MDDDLGVGGLPKMMDDDDGLRGGVTFLLVLDLT